jgi:coenzyme F420-0:L-glutamate ligase/coenzyme F420-1:gamma-L-glutamate ligase
MQTISFYGVPDVPRVIAGDDLAVIITSSLDRSRFALLDGDVIVIAQKIVSKAEGAVVRLSDVLPSEPALALAHVTGRDPRLCEIYIRESEEILGTKGSMVITRHRLGFENTNACVDRSNVAPRDEEQVVLLPRDPDASAQGLRANLRERTGRDVAVIVSDSFGKPDRDGAIGTAIGIAAFGTLKNVVGMTSSAIPLANPFNWSMPWPPRRAFSWVR